MLREIRWTSVLESIDEADAGVICEEYFLVGSVLLNFAGVYSVGNITYHRKPGRGGGCSVKYSIEVFGKVRYGLSTLPNTPPSSVRTRYRYPTLQ